MKRNLKIIIGIVFSIITFIYSSSIKASQIDTTSIRDILLINKIKLDYNHYALAQQQLGADKAIFMFPKKSIVENKQIITINARLKQVSYKSIDFNNEQLSKDLSINDISPLGASSILINTNDGEFIYNTITNTVVKRDSIIDYSKEGLSITDTIVIILYFLILLFIGIFFSKRQKSSDDYFKGGSRIPWWAAGLSLFGTALSAITFMAIPAKSYSTDWSYMLFNVGIVLVAPIIMFIFIPFFRKLNITTAYQYLEIRFNSIIRVICSLAFIIFQVGRMGVVLFLPAIAINIVTGFNIFLCIGLMGIFSILYTRMGGIEAVVWTDALQVIILLGGAIFAIVHIIANIPGGLSETYNLAIGYDKLNLGDISFDITNPTVWTVLIATCFTNLTMYGTDQSMVQRYLTTSSKKAAQKSVLTNALLTIPATIIFFLIGTVLFVFYKTHPFDLNPSMQNTDAIFPYYIYTKLPTGIIGLLISGIFAAAMSTLSGSMNSAATAYVVDIRPKLLRSKSDTNISLDNAKKHELRIAKRATMIIGLLSLMFAFMMATWNINSLWDEFNKILGLILGSMGGLFMLGMVTKRANWQGAIIGMIVSIIVQVLVANYTPVYLLLYTSVGFITCFIVGYIASLFFKSEHIN